MISDPMWKQSILDAVPIEDECYGGYRMLLVASDKPVGVFIYPFRMFFFPNDGDEPVLALSLELGNFYGTCALGVHDSEKHYNYGSANPNMSIDEFKVWALETVKKHLNLSK